MTNKKLKNFVNTLNHTFVLIAVMTAEALDASLLSRSVLQTQSLSISHSYGVTIK